MNSYTFFSPKIYGYVRKHPNGLLENTLSRKENVIKNIDIDNNIRDLFEFNNINLEDQNSLIKIFRPYFFKHTKQPHHTKLHPKLE